VDDYVTMCCTLEFRDLAGLAVDHRGKIGPRDVDVTTIRIEGQVIEASVGDRYAIDEFVAGAAPSAGAANPNASATTASRSNLVFKILCLTRCNLPAPAD
jgi:hypothetical protein